MSIDRKSKSIGIAVFDRTLSRVFFPSKLINLQIFVTLSEGKFFLRSFNLSLLPSIKTAL